MEIINGVRFALDEQRSPLVSRPIIRSVRGQIETIGVVQELCRNPSIRAIIGPLTTQNAIAAAAVANAHDMVLLTPTATGDGISAIGPNVFQANSTPAAQGRLLASVAMDSLHARTVATLSSVSPDDKAMATAFADEVRKKGGEVFVQEWFFPNTEDWRPQLMQIRTAGLMRDTTLKEETRQKLALGEPTELDTMRLMREVTTIDVMLVSSASQEDLIKLAAQIPTQKIWARVLGGVVWGSQNVRQQAGEDAEGIIFTTNYGAAGTRQFEDRYRLVRRQQPNIVTALSYDAASLVIRSVHDGARTRAQVREMLASQQNWPGASGRITFGPDGSNTEAVVRIVRGGTVRAVFDWSHLVRPSHWGVAAQVVDGDAESEGEEGAENAEDAEE